MVYAVPPFISPQEEGYITIQIPQIIYYQHGENITFNFHVYNYTGYILDNTTTNCTIHMYNNLGEEIIDEDLIFEGYDFIYVSNDSVFQEGEYYSYLVDCQSDMYAGFISTFFQVTYEGAEKHVAGFPIAIIILIPLIFSILTIVGAATLSEQHSALRIFLFLLSFVGIWTSLHLSVITLIRYYAFPELQELLGTTTYFIGITFFAIVSYFIIYLFYILVQQAAQRKKERLQY